MTFKHKIKKRLKSFATAIVAFMTVAAGAMPVYAETVYQAKAWNGITYMTYFPPGVTTCGGQNYTYSPNGEYLATSDGKPAYCIEPNKDLVVGSDIYKTDDINTYAGYSTETKERIAKITHFGFMYGNHTDPLYWQVTQMMIWEACDGRNFTGSQYIEQRSDGQYDVTSTAIAYQEEIERLIRELDTRPSYTATNQRGEVVGTGISPTINAYVGDTITIHDNNGVLSNYYVVNNGFGGNASFSGNDISITVTETGSKSITTRSNEARVDTQGGTLLLYDDSSDAQACIKQGAVNPGDSIITVNATQINLQVNKQDANGNGIAGSVLQIKEGDTVLYEITSTADGFAIPNANKLRIGGTYTLHEVSAPTGYVKANDVSFTVNDANTSVTMTDGQVFAEKLDGNGERLGGAKMQVLSSDKSTVIDEWTTTTEPHAIKGLTEGETYILHEAKAPRPEYALAKDASFTATSGTVSLQAVDATVTIKKQDDNARKVIGAELSVYDREGNLVDQWKTDGKTDHSIKGLKEGNVYTVKETVVPYGYKAADDFTITPDQVDHIYDMIDERMTITVKATKRDAVDNDLTLGGAEFTVFKADGVTIAKDADGNDAVKLTTVEENGSCTFSIPYEPEGYIIKETKAPEGYTLDDPDQQWVVKPTPDSGYTFSPEDDMFFFTKTDTADTSIKIIKHDNDKVGQEKKTQGEATLAGAKYQLYDTVLLRAVGEFVTDKNGESNTIENLPFLNSDGTPREYILLEVKAPNGYYLDEELHYFHITDGENTDGGYDYVAEFGEAPILGKFKITKGIYDKYQSNISDREEGAEFKAVLKKYYDQYKGVEEAYNALSADPDQKQYEHEYCSLVTNENGVAESGDLAYGTYVVKQTKTSDPEVKPIDEEFLFEVGQNRTKVKRMDGTVLIEDYLSETLPIYMGNEAYEYELYIIKKDAETGERIKYNSASFRIKDDKGNYITMDKREKRRPRYTIFKTTSETGDKALNDNTYYDPNGEKGAVITPDVLRAGTYYVEELDIPEGMLKAEDAKVVVKKSQIASFDESTGKPYIVVEMLDSQPTGEINIEKIIKELPDNIKADTSLVEDVKHDMSGIKFTLKSKETLYSPIDHSVIFNAGDVVGEYNLSKDGKLSIKDLPMGLNSEGKAITKYTLEETEVPEGIVRDETIHDVTFTQKDTSTKVYSESLKIYNATTGIKISKKDVKNKAVVGSTMQIQDTAGNIIDEWISSETPHVIEGLSIDETYTLIETDAANGKVIAKPMDVKVDPNGKVTETKMIDKTVTVSKVDMGGKEVVGATMSVTDADGAIVDEWVSSETTHEINNLEEGKNYILHETIASDGYVKATDIPFTVDGADEKGVKTDQHIDMTDTIVTVSKSDMNGQEVKGAEMSVTDEAGNIIDTWISDGTEHRVKGLEEGRSYVLHEDTAPAGFVKVTNIPFTVLAGEAKADLHFDVIDKVVEFTKTDANGNFLDNAEISVYEVVNNVRSETAADVWETGLAPHRIENLTAGKTYVAVETKVPEGYVKATDIIFEVADDNTDQKITMVNKLVEAFKKDVDVVTIPGAEMRVIDADGNTIDEWISSDESHRIKGLEAGKTYTLIETKAPAGYVKAADIVFTVSDDGKDQVEIMVDKKVTMTKEDLGGKEIAGAEMSVTDADGNVIDSWTSGDKAHEIENLIIGNTYVLHENTAPLGYVKATDITFTVEEDNKNQSITMTDNIVTVSKHDVGGEEVIGAKMSVTDEAGNTVDEWVSDGTDHKVNGLEEGRSYVLHEDTAPAGYVKITDIPFTVTSGKAKADQNIKAIDKVVTVSKHDLGGEEVIGAEMSVTDEEGNIIDEWTSSNEPHAVSNLEEGRKYILHENTAPAGYVKATDIAFEVTGADKDGIKVDQEIDMTDIVVTLTKEDGGELEVPGAHIQVIDSDGNIVDEWTSTDTPHRIENLVEGQTYTMHEEGAPDGYYYSTDSEFTVTKDGITELKMIDKPIKYEIMKIDDIDGSIVEGVVLKLYDITGEEEVEVSPEGGWVTTDKPIVLTMGEAGNQKLIAGHKYRLVEEEYVAGVYQATSVEFAVDKYNPAGDEAVTITMVDVTTNVNIIKTDDTGKPLAGAKMSILETSVDQDGNIVAAKDENGNEIIAHEWITTDKPEDISAYVKGGETYIVREDESPFGFKRIEEQIIKITGTQEEHQIIVLKDERETFYVAATKVDVYDTSKKLKGAQITIFNSDGTVAKDVNGKDCIGITDGEGNIIFNLPYSEKGYYAQETGAPEGYLINNNKYEVKLSKDYNFAKDNPIVIVVADTPMNKTGVGYHAPLVAGGIGCAAIVALAVLFATRRKEDEVEA